MSKRVRSSDEEPETLPARIPLAYDPDRDLVFRGEPYQQHALFLPTQRYDRMVRILYFPLINSLYVRPYNPWGYGSITELSLQELETAYAVSDRAIKRLSEVGFIRGTERVLYWETNHQVTLADIKY